MEDFYVISEKVDSVKFFQSLSKYFKDATTLFIEGTSIVPNVLKIYNKNLENGDYLPSIGTIFPSSKKLRCKFSDEFMREMALVAGRQAEPELLDHLHLYKDGVLLIEWKDAFFDDIFVSKSIPQKTVDQFAADIKDNINNQ